MFQQCFYRILIGNADMEIQSQRYLYHCLKWNNWSFVKVCAELTSIPWEWLLCYIIGGLTYFYHHFIWLIRNCINRFVFNITNANQLQMNKRKPECAIVTVVEAFTYTILQIKSWLSWFLRAYGIHPLFFLCKDLFHFNLNHWVLSGWGSKQRIFPGLHLKT